MDTPPQLSVIVPAYNVERFLDKCLRSIQTQTFTDFEVILINNGSTDSTLQICRTWTRDPRFRLISRDRQPVGTIRNLGIQESHAPQIMFVDADDYLEPDAIATLLAIKEQHQAQISAGRFVRESLSGRKLKTRTQLGDIVLTGTEAYTLALFDQKLQSYSWAKIYDKALFDGIAYPAENTFEDYVVNYQVFGRAQRMVSTRKLVYHYVQHHTSLMNNMQYAYMRDCSHLEAHYKRYIDVKNDDRLNRRQFALFRVKTIRRILRNLRNIQSAQPLTAPTILPKVLRYLSEVNGAPIENDVLNELWHWTLRKKLQLSLFYWKK